MISKGFYQEIKLIQDFKIMQNQIQHGTYIRNGFGVTFQVLFIDKNIDHEFTFLKNLDNDKTLRMESKTFKALVKLKNYTHQID